MDQHDQLNDLLNSMEGELLNSYIDYHYLGENRIDTLHHFQTGRRMVIEWRQDNGKWVDLNKMVDDDGTHREGAYDRGHAVGFDRGRDYNP